MIGQHNNRIDCKWTPRMGVAECAAKQFNIFREQTKMPVFQIDREKICAARDKVATVVGHDEFGWWASLALSATLQASLPVANVLLSFAA